jgi:hypothetical protein
LLAAWPAAAWSGLLLAALPWLPLPLPAARFVWLGPLAWLAWAGAVATGVASMTAERPPWPSVLATWTGERRRGGWLAGTIALVLFTSAYASVRSILPGGDEPHYLVIAESLRRDGDIAIDDNHERGDYLTFFRGELAPDYLRRGVDRRIYSIHAPGLPVLLLPAYAALGYAGVVAALLIASAWGAALLWRLVRDVTADAGAAWFAWAAAVLASPILFHTFTVFPDGVAGIAALVGVRGLSEIAGARRDRDPSAPASWATLVTSGAALAVLPWLHTRAAVIAAALGLAIVATAIWRRTPWPRVAAFAIVPMLSAAGWFGYFQRVYGTLDPSAPYGGYTQTAWAHVPAGLAGLLLDAQFGVLGVAPVFALSLVGLVWMATGDSSADRAPVESSAGDRTVAVAIVAAFVGYAAASASYRMWWGGASAPARFLVPMLPLLVAAVALRLAQSRSGLARWWSGLLLTGFVLSIVALADPAARLLLNRGNRPTRLWAALSGDVAIGDYLPTLTHASQRDALLALVWLVALGLLLALDRLARVRSRVDGAFRSLAVPVVVVVLACAIIDGAVGPPAPPTPPAAGERGGEP